MPRPRLLAMPEGPRVRWLFLDLNAYFASVEQQERPELRGRPIAVVPMITENTVCIAASYEAKSFGVKTGTKLADARAMCPGLELVEARPQLYVEYHHAIVEAAGRCLPVSTVMSVDEMACELMGREQALNNALQLAESLKQELRGVGETLRCSIGLAPNRYLAKVASDMEKPDGLTFLLKGDLPQSLFGLAPADLPGIGGRMQARLEAAGIRTLPQLAALSPGRMRALWGSVLGERMWHWMRGADFHDPPAPRRSLGRQHVLAPEFRTREAALAVALKLLHLAATELRRLELWAAGLGVQVDFLRFPGQPQPGDPYWEAHARIEECRDDFLLQRLLRRLWRGCPAAPPISVGVRLDHLASERQHTLPLFANEEQRRRERASAAMDELNLKFGPQTVYPGGLHGVRTAAPTRISFSSIPDLKRF